MTETERKAKEDFRIFLYLVWKFLKLPEPTPTQYELASYLMDTSVKRKCILAFRGVGKSYVTAAYTLWRLFRNPDENILCVSASKDRSDANSRFIKMLISEMPMLKYLTPKTGHGFDSIEKFTVAPAQISQSPSVKSVGLFGAMVGTRATIILADDCESPALSETENQRQKCWARLAEFSSVLKPDSPENPDNQIIYLGTPQTTESAYARLKKERGYDVKIWPARLPSYGDVEKYNEVGELAPSILSKMEKGVAAGTPTDTRFDEKELLERSAEYGKSGFALQFQLDTSLSDAEKYPLKLSDLVIMDVDVDVAPAKIVWGSSPKDNGVEDIPVIGLPGDRYFGRIPVPDEKWLPYSGTVMAIDPSGRGKDETSYTVMSNLHGTLFVKRCGGLKGGYEPKTLSRLAAIAKEEKVNQIICEPNFGDGMWMELFKPVLREIYPVGIEDSPRAQGQKERRIIDVLEPLANTHRLVFDRAMMQKDAKEKDHDDPHYTQRKLAYQLTRLTADRGSLRHDDRVESLAIAARYWVDQIAVSADEAVADHMRDLWEKELDDFMDSAMGVTRDTNQTWVSPMGINGRN